MNLVSIIMPVKNAGKSLDRAIASLVAQTYKNIEIILIDDGSTDESLDVIKGYTARFARVKLAEHAQTLGPATARNTGLDKAKGDYIMFCDADDWYSPEMVEKMVYEMDTSGVDLAVCQTSLYDETNLKLPPDALIKEKLINKHSLRNIADGPKPDTGQQISSVLWDKIFKKSLLDKYSIRFFDGCYNYEDMHFCHKYCLVANSICLVRSGGLYNHQSNRPGSLTNLWQKSPIKDRLTLLPLCEDMLAFSKTHQLENRHNDEAGSTFEYLFALAKFLTPSQLTEVINWTNLLFEKTPHMFMVQHDSAEPTPHVLRVNLDDKESLSNIKNGQKAISREKWRRRLNFRKRTPDPAAKLAAKIESMT